MKTKIRFTRKRLNYNLFFGIAWLILGILKMLTDTPLNGIDYAWFAIAGLSMGTYFYEYTHQYLTIERGIISKSYPFGNKIKLEEIKYIKKFAGDYILKTDQTELTINTQIIDKKSLSDLNEILGKLDLPPEKTPFVDITNN
ncbi:hypothetical protein DHD05_21960 [Arenibacter sp. N53]|uniref:hypothetical protein n=1 Tax=Arenibacter TaxID=178469 RepID=UPI000CD43CDC|nr:MULTISPECIES: hypothetical protein [Arenibacter]MCM4154262.1 hypothetical protein [Arenibacter sp. N53]